MHLGEEFVVTALSIPKHLFKISHLFNVHQSYCLEANSCSSTGIPNTGNNLEHRHEGQSEVATKVSFNIQLCVEGPQKPKCFLLDLKLKARIIPRKITEFRKYQKFAELLPGADFPMRGLITLILVPVYVWNKDRCL